MYLLAHFLYDCDRPYGATGESHDESPRNSSAECQNPGLAAIRRPDLAVGFSHCARGFDVSRGAAAKRNDRNGLRYARRSRSAGFGLCGLRLAGVRAVSAATRRRRLSQLALYRRCRRAGRLGLSLLYLVTKPHGSIRRPVAAFSTASVRVAAPSLPRALSIWKSTVRLVRSRIWAISAEVLPRAAQVKTSTSRSLSAIDFGHSPVRATPASRAVMMAASMSKSIGFVT